MTIAHGSTTARLRQIAPLPLFAAAMAVLLPMALWSRLVTPSRTGGTRPSAARGSGAPLRIEHDAGLSGLLSPKDVTEALERLRLDRPVSLPTMLHAARLFGPGVAFADPGTGEPVGALEIALDERKARTFFGGKSGLVEARHGVRVLVASPREDKKPAERQAHMDQLLAVLGEAGIPLGQRVQTATGQRSVQSILDEAVAGFDPHQEIEWTAMALTLYLPPKRNWSDKFGRTYDFDDLADELLSRPFDREGIACDGTHLLYALVLLARADEQKPILSASARRRVRDHLASVAARVMARQEPDGAWSRRWYEPARPDAPPPTPGPQPERVHVTGHHLEWLLLLPREMRPSEDCTRRVALWLRDQILAAPRQTIVEHYCPYSHAANVLRIVASHGRDERSPTVGDHIETAPPERR